MIWEIEHETRVIDGLDAQGRPDPAYAAASKRPRGDGPITLRSAESGLPADVKQLRELMLRQTPRTLSELAAQVVVAAGGGIGPDCAHGGYIADGAFLQTLTLMAEDGE